MGVAGNRNSELKSFPDSRVSTIDVCELGLRKHHMKALLEIDITNARDIFRIIKERDGESLSFTAWLVKCISTAVGEYREANAFLKSRKALLIFDEIDTGISGRIAQKVGQNLKSLAAYHQIISITHLPQIAALANNHFAIEKKTVAGRVISSLRKLSEDEKVTEVAKLLSGENVTSASLNSAKELMKH